jgi:hypothetical protein
MQAKGSLFLQHLKIEAEVILDSGGEFRKFVDSCQFIPPSRSELVRCEVAIKTIIAWPNDQRTDSWKGDWLYCVLRDYLVKRLAAKGNLAFGIGDIAHNSKQEWGLIDSQLYCLKQLRLNKAVYRSDLKGKKFKSSLFSEVKSLIDTIDGNRHSGLLEYPVDLLMLGHTQLNTHYQWLRALEGMYILARSSGYMHPSHQNLMKLIQQPNLYHSSTKLMHRDIRNYYHDVLRAVTANKTMQPTAIPLRNAMLHSAG